MTGPALDESKFYLMASAVGIALAVLAPAVMHAAGVGAEQVTATVTLTLAVVTVVVSQYRTAAQVQAALEASVLAAATEADRTRRTLAVATAEAVAKTAEVAATLEVSDRLRAKQLQEIKVIGEKTHVLVNNEHGIALRVAADALHTVAKLIPTAENRLAADRAEEMARAHESKQAVVDAEQARSDEQGAPES